MSVPYTVAQASDPNASSETLAAIAANQPELRPYVALNTAAYPELLDWLGKLGDPAVDQALRQRAGAGQTAFGAASATAPNPYAPGAYTGPAATGPVYAAPSPTQYGAPAQSYVQGQSYGAPAQQYAAPMGYGQPGYALTGYQPKSRLVAGLLGIFLGYLGVHRFYMGYIGIGIVQILVTIVTFGVGGLWGLVEGIIIVSGSMQGSSLQQDARGVPLTA